MACIMASGGCGRFGQGGRGVVGDGLAPDALALVVALQAVEVRDGAQGASTDGSHHPRQLVQLTLA